MKVANSVLLRGANRFGPCLLVTAVALFVFGAWLTNHAIETHEGIDPYVRTQQISQEIGNGNFPPQVLPDARLGASTAFPRFYPPLPYLASSLIGAIASDVVLGVNLSLVLAALLSGFTMAWTIRRVGGNPWIAAGAAAIYLAAPYHLYDANVRGALAEMWAFVWFPLIFVAANKTIERERLSLLLPIATAGLLLSHTISLILVAFVFAIFGGVTIMRRSWRGLAVLCIGVALGVGLSAFYIVPQQLELGDVFASSPAVMLTTDVELNQNRVAFGDLVGDAATAFRGYTGDAPLLAIPNLVVGPITLALPLVALAMYLRDRSRNTTSNAFREFSVFASCLALAIIVWLLFIIWPSAFSAIAPSQLAYIQFPWRALGPIAAAVSILWAILLRDRRYGSSVLVAIGIVSAVALPSAQRDPVDRADQTDRCFRSEDVRSPNDYADDGCFVRGGEFDPVAVGPMPSRAVRSAFGFTSRFEYLPTTADATDPARGVTKEPTVEGKGVVTGWERTSDGMRIAVDATTDVIVRIPITAYRFVSASTNGVPSDRVDHLGLVAVKVEPGHHDIVVSRTRTFGDYIGYLGTLATAAILIAAGRRRQRQTRATTVSA